MNKTVLFHHPCMDGVGAAWCLHLKFNAEADAAGDRYIPTDYHKPIPWGDIDNREVYIVDFSYETDVLKEVIKRASRVVMLDHHARSAQIVDDITLWMLENAIPDSRAFIRYCGAMSGAMMAWEYAFPDTAPPKIIEHISDRDLWQFKLPDTKEVMAALGTYALELPIWVDLFGQHNDGYDVAEFLKKPQPVTVVAQRMRKNEMNWALETTKRFINIGWTEDNGISRNAMVPLLNCHPSVISEALASMTDDYLFTMAYFDMPEGRRFSLRSKTYDVRQVARHYGGEGHANASGFTVPRTHLFAQL